ncbi:hypothetical protein L596_016111 [Steinernema carpocapsae]|uniref:C-type lectin domain-containing protein n=1 Tax=Steinernema carpocapsae TaxID=34508 RepID=A0A4U5NHM5_STECR|nr:hypothetical protein L596_016111 [Steinernema carpocapsae]
MKTLLLFALVALASSSSCPQGAIKSSDGSKCFQFLSHAQEWSQAQETCTELGGNLVSIPDGLENNQIAEQAYAVFGRKNASGNFWSGGNDLATHGKWSWIDGSGFGFANWAPGQPGNGINLDCVSVDMISGLWKAENSFLKKPFVCEIPVVNPTTCPPRPTCPALSCPTPAPCVQKACQEYCPSEWTYFAPTHACYKVNHGKKFWDAEQYCVSENSHLASIHSTEENSFVASLATAYMTMANYHQSWIGAYSPNKDYTFAWTDGTSWDYKHWAHKQPDHRGKENCAIILSDESVWVGEDHWYEEWDNVDCDYDMRSYVCKQPAKKQP